MRLIVIDEETGEPLTIAEVPASLMRAVEGGMMPRKLFLQVVQDPPSIFDTPPTPDMGPMSFMLRYDVVALRLEPVMRGRRFLYWHAFPDDPVLALKLRAAFLPGQLGEVQRREEAAWFFGAMKGARL